MRRTVLRERIGAPPQQGERDLSEARGIAGLGLRHRPNPLADGPRIVGRSGFRVAAQAAGRLPLRGFQVVGRLAFGGDRTLGIEPVEGLIFPGQLLPHGVLRHRHPAGVVGRAVRQRFFPAFQEGADVVGSPMAVVHGVHDGRRAKGAVAGGKDPGVGRAHGLELGLYPAALHHPQAVEFTADRLQTDSGQHCLDVDPHRLVGVENRVEATFGVEHRHTAHELDAGHLAVLVQDLLGSPGRMDDDPLFFSIFDLLLPRRHFAPRLQAEDLHLPGSHAQTGSGHVHGHVTSPYDRCPAFEGHGCAPVDFGQPIETVEPRQSVFLSRHAELPVAPQTNGQQNGIVALLEVFHADLIAQRAVQVHLDARTLLENAVDVLFDDAARQAEFGDVEDHASEAVPLLVHVDLVTQFGQILGGGQPRRSAAHHADCLFFRHRNRRQVIVAAEPVQDKALEIADSHRPVAFGPAAVRLAGHGADPSANRAERVGGGDSFERLGELLFPDQADVRRHVSAHRTGFLTGGRNPLDVVSLIAVGRRRCGRYRRFAHALDAPFSALC